MSLPPHDQDEWLGIYCGLAAGVAAVFGVGSLWQLVAVKFDMEYLLLGILGLVAAVVLAVLAVSFYPKGP